MGFFPTDVGAQVKVAVVGAGTATAAGTGDATKVTGQAIDRRGYLSGVLAVAYKAVLTESKTLSLAVEVQESADGSNWDTAEELKAAAVVATGAAGGSTEYGELKISDDLSGRKRYLRYNITPDLSHSSTDTLVWGATFILGGAVVKPAE